MKGLDALKGSTHIEDCFGQRVEVPKYTDLGGGWSIDLHTRVLSRNETEEWIIAFFWKLELLLHKEGLRMADEIAFEVYDDD